jgi:Tfp pilus assembly protein PilV
LTAQRGSILIEVLLSVVILGVSLTVVLRSLMTSLRAVDLAADYTRGLILAENKMTEYVDKNPEGNFYKKDVCEKSTDRFFCTVDITKQDFSDESGGLSRLDLTVSWPSGRSRKEISLVTYLFDAL